MSILLIGQNARFSHPNRPSLFSNYQNQDSLKQKRLAKQKYRNDLLYQIRQRQQKRKRDKSKELQQDIKYQIMFYQKIAENNKKINHQIGSPKANNTYEQYDYNDQSNHRYRSKILPPINASPSFKSKLKPIKNEDYSFDRYRQRIATQPINPRQEIDDQYRSFFESAQLRQKKLQDQLDTKVNQVYNMMANSIKTINETQEMHQFNSKLSPIKLNMDKHYKIKYLNNSQPQYEDTRNYYKLPNISKSFKTQQNEADLDWKEWYSKQKLRQLQNQYSNELGVSKFKKQFDNRIKTPSFVHSKF